MIVVANRIAVAKGYEAEFEERLRTRQGLVEGEPGFVRNMVLKPLEAETYVVMTYWQDQASFEAWTQSEAFAQAHSRRPPKEMFSGPNKLEIHEVLTDTGG